MANYSVQGTIASSSSAASVSLVPRWAYITIQNEGSVGIWVRTDGQAAAVAGDYSFYVGPASALLLANMAPLWYQSATVIPESTSGRGNINPSDPSENQPYGSSYYGQLANPGTTVSVILSTGSSSQTFAVAAAG
jgi:hypothetical protein